MTKEARNPNDEAPPGKVRLCARFGTWPSRWLGRVRAVWATVLNRRDIAWRSRNQSGAPVCNRLRTTHRAKPVTNRRSNSLKKSSQNAMKLGDSTAKNAAKTSPFTISAFFTVLSHRIDARREDFSRGLERRFSTGLAWWVVQSRLQTGAPLCLQLRRAASLRFAWAFRNCH